MKKRQILSLAALAIFATFATTASAATIIDNNFDSVATATYNGILGAEYGATANLGNATGNRNNIAVNATGGVNGSKYISQSNGDPAIRSRSFYDIGTVGTTSFSSYFRWEPSATNNLGAIAMGWSQQSATYSTTDNVSFYNATIDGVANSTNHRLLIGLNRPTTGTNDVQFAGFGRLGGVTALTGAPAAVALTVGDWYQLSFDLTFNYDSGTPADSTLTVADLNLQNWGTDGLTGGSSVMSMADSTFNPAFGNALDTNRSAYAVVVGNGPRGTNSIDNVLVTAIPEPSSLALLSGALGALALLRRRRA